MDPDADPGGSKTYDADLDPEHCPVFMFIIEGKIITLNCKFVPGQFQIKIMILDISNCSSKLRI
jgi:hypothetical protein